MNKDDAVNNNDNRACLQNIYRTHQMPRTGEEADDDEGNMVGSIIILFSSKTLKRIK